MRKGEALAWLAVAGGVAALGGCGVKISATHVPPDEANVSQLTREGIYYALPRTRVHLTVPMLLAVFAKGRLGAVYEDCLAACKEKPAQPPKACALPLAATIQVLRPEVTLRGVPDPDHFYRVSVDAEMFSSVQHKLALNELGIIASAESSASDTTFEVIGGLVGAVASAAASISLSSERV